MINHQSIKTIDEEKDIVVIKMEDIPPYDIEDYDLMDDKDRAKYIKDLERIVRNSFEYRQFIQYLRENMDMDKCAIMENVTNKDNFKVRIELHHSPFTLYDICSTVLNRRLALGLPTNIEMVALEVVGLHYYLFVGLIPLSETTHQLVHNQYLFVPVTKVLGDYQSFVDIYHDYIAPELLETYENNLEYSQKMQQNDFSILKEVPTYVDNSHLYQLPSYQSMLDSMYGRINEIKQLQDPFTETPKTEYKTVVIDGEEKQVVPGIIFE